MTYCILPYNDITEAMVAACVQTSLASVRTSAPDENGVAWGVLKWNGAQPAALSGHNGTEYDNVSIHVALQAAHWLSPEPQ